MRKNQFLDNLIHVTRYSGNILIKPESVADHTWGMIALALEYIPAMNEKFKVDWELPQLVYLIALHDIDESLYCDIPRKFKYHSQDLREAIQVATDELLEENLSPEIVLDIKYADDKTSLMGFMVKIFDIAQAGYKMISEINLGNKFFKSEITNAIDSLVGLRNKIGDLKRSECENEALKWLIDEFCDEFNKYVG